MPRGTLAIVLQACCAGLCVASTARAADLPLIETMPPAAWIVEFGGYGVMEPLYEGSKHYGMSFKPIVDYNQVGDREWLSFPNDAITVDFYETSNFHVGAAGAITLKSRYHGDDIDLRLGKASVNVQTGGFVEYYPLDVVRARAEVLQGVVGSSGLALNLSADYIWRPYPDWTFTAGPRAQIVNDHYASDYFSTQLAIKNNNYIPYRAEGGVLSSGAEITGKYEWTKAISTKFFIDFNQLMGDAADSPRVNIKGNAEQVVLGIGASYKFAVGR